MPKTRDPAELDDVVVVETAERAELLDAIGESNPGATAPTPFTQPLAANVLGPQPTQEVARVQTRDGTSRMWAITLGDLGGVGINGINTGEFPAGAVPPPLFQPFSIGWTKCLVRFGRGGAFQQVELDWRVGQQFCVYASSVSVNWVFAGYYVQAGATVRAKAWITEAPGAGGAAHFPPTWTFPGIIVVNSLAFSTTFPVPAFARQVALYQDTALATTVRTRLECISNAPALSTSIYNTGAANTRPLSHFFTPVDVPAFTQSVRIHNDSPDGNVSYVLYYRLAF